MASGSEPMGDPKWRRRPWAASLLSLLLPGLGQMYNGELRKGLFFYLLTSVVGVFLYAAAGRSLSLILLAVVLLAQLAVQLAAVIEAGVAARRIGGNFRPEAYNRPLVYVGTYLLFGLLVSQASSWYIRENVIEAFSIPSASMEPTLFFGDQILVDKTAAVFNRGDIVVFEFPEDAGKKNPRAFLKRIVGLPGDEIEIREKQLLVNGRPLVENYIAHYENAILPATIAPRDFLAPITVPPDMYFLLGDNRDRSYDSRFWGCVEKGKVHGKVAQIYWSWDRQQGEVRWGRIGRKIL